jgi:hypothetical protein
MNKVAVISSLVVIGLIFGNAIFIKLNPFDYDGEYAKIPITFDINKSRLTRISEGGKRKTKKI